ncbi:MULTISPECIES: hypothetical protein [Leptolyngbya]
MNISSSPQVLFRINSKSLLQVNSQQRTDYFKVLPFATMQD